MTQKANPSANRPAEAFKTAGAIAYGGHGGDGFVREAGNPTEISIQDADIVETDLNAFNESSSGSSLNVTIDPGEAFVFGSWICKDTNTVVSLDASTSGQLVSVGWDRSDSNDVIVGTSSDFRNAANDTDQSIPLFSFDTDSSGVISVSDERNIGSQANNLRADSLLIHGRTLPNGDSITLTAEEGSVVSEEYTVNGTLNIEDGSSITVI